MVDYLSRKRSKFKLRCCFKLRRFGLNYHAVFEDGGLNYILIKGWCYFVYTCFWWLCYHYLYSHIVTSIIILSHTVVDIQFSPLKMFLSIPPRWLYMVMLFLLQLTQLSSQLSTKISTIKEFPNQLYIQRKSHSVCYVQSCYIADTCTERVTHFRFSSGRHMHASHAYFCKVLRLFFTLSISLRENSLVYCILNSFFLPNHGCRTYCAPNTIRKGRFTIYYHIHISHNFT